MAAYYFWTGSGNWNVLTNWSTAQNIHTIPASLPTYGDSISFVSGSLLGLYSSSNSSTITGDLSCSAVVFDTGYIGSVTMSNAVLHISASQAIVNGQVNLSAGTIISASGSPRAGFRIFGSSSISFGGGKYEANLTLAKGQADSLSNAQQSYLTTHSVVDTCIVSGNLYLNDISQDAFTSVVSWYINDISGGGNGGFVVVNGTIYLMPLSWVVGTSFIRLKSSGGFIVTASSATTSADSFFGLYSSINDYGLLVDAPAGNVTFISDLNTSSYTAKRRNLYFNNTKVNFNQGTILIPNSGSTFGITNPKPAGGNSTVSYIKSAAVPDFTIPRLFFNLLNGTSNQLIFNYDQNTPFTTNMVLAGVSGTTFMFINSGSTNTPLVVRDGQVSLVSAGASFLSGSATLILTGSIGALVSNYTGTGVSPFIRLPLVIDTNKFVLGRWLHTVPEQQTNAPSTSGSVGWLNPYKASGSLVYAGPRLVTGSNVQTWQTTGPSGKGSTLILTSDTTTTLSTYPIVFDQVLITGSSIALNKNFTASLESELSASSLTVKNVNATFIPISGGWQVGTYNVVTPGTTQSFGTSSTAPAGNTYTYDFNILNNFISSGSEASPITYRAVPVNAGRSASLNLEIGGSQAVTWSLNRDVDSGRGQAITSSLGSNQTAWTGSVSGIPNSPFLTRQVNWFAYGAATTNNIELKKINNLGFSSDTYGSVFIESGPNTGTELLDGQTTTVSSDSSIDFYVEASAGYYIQSYYLQDSTGGPIPGTTVAVNAALTTLNVLGSYGNVKLVVVFALQTFPIVLKSTTGGSVTHVESGISAVDTIKNGVTVVQGSDNNFTILPSPGYQISKVVLIQYGNPGRIQTSQIFNLGPVSTAQILDINNKWEVCAFFSLIPPPSTGTTSSYAQLAVRYCLGSDNKKENWYTTSSYRSQHPNQNITAFDAGLPKIATFHNFPTTINYYNPIVEVHSTEWPDLSGNRSISNKIRVDNTFLTGEDSNVLYRNNSVQRSIIDNQPPDTSRLGVYFSPTNETNQDIAEQFGGLSIDDFIGDPSYLSLESYPGLEELHFGYFKKYGHHWKASGSNADITSSMRPPGPQNYIKLLKYYDASLFKLIKKFIPYRANAQVGLVIEPHLLSRSKLPTKTPTFENLSYTSSIEIPEVYTPGGFVQDGDGEPFRNGPGYVEEAVIDGKRVITPTAEVLPVQLEDAIETALIQPLRLSGNANEYNNGGVDDQPSGYDVGDKLYDEIDFGITSYGRDARVEGSQYVFMTYATSGSGNNVSEPYLITSSRYDYHEAQGPVIMSGRRSEIANVTNNIYDVDIFNSKAFQDYTVYSDDATPSTVTTYTSSNAIWENNWTSRFGLTFVSLITASVLQPSPFSTKAYWRLGPFLASDLTAAVNQAAGTGLQFIAETNASTIPVTSSVQLPAFFYNELDPNSKDYLYKISITTFSDLAAAATPELILSFGSLNSTLSQSITYTSNIDTNTYTTKATGNYLGLKMLTKRTSTGGLSSEPQIRSLKVECLNYRADVQDFHLQDSYGMRNARYDGCKLTATDYNVDSTDTVDGGPVIQITIGGGNELIVRPGNKGVFTTQTLLKSGQAQIKKKGGLGAL